jgi:hypothetical protein
MAVKIVELKNTALPIGSWAFAVPLGRVAVSVAVDNAVWRAELKVNGEAFAGKGSTAVMALRDLETAIMKAAVKHQGRGRAPERVRVAASLLHGGPE